MTLFLPLSPCYFPLVVSRHLSVLTVVFRLSRCCLTVTVTGPSAAITCRFITRPITQSGSIVQLSSACALLFIETSTIVLTGVIHLASLTVFDVPQLLALPNFFETLIT